MYQQITIKTLHNQGVNKSQIAKELSCHRNTVSNVLRRDKLLETQTRSKPSIFDPYEQTVKEWLDQKISRLRIHEMLQENFGFLGSYDNLCKYIQKHFPKKTECYGVQVTTPGEVAEVDFGYLGMMPGILGKPVKTYGLAVVLPYSRLDFYWICYDQKLDTLTSGLKAAFTYFGGVPKRLKVDNMKTAVLKNQHYDLSLNQGLLEFCYHYNTVIIPCSPYSPEQKGTVESQIKYLQRNFIAGRCFQDGADLKRQLAHWLDRYANSRVHGTTRWIPRQVFEMEEKPQLQSLPKEEFAFFNRGIRLVLPNCHIHFENNYYSVPASLVGQEVTVRWSDHLLRIIHQGCQVALHQRSKMQGTYVTERAHLPSDKIYSQTEYQARYEAKMTDIGEYALKYFSMLLQTKESYWFRIVRIILGLEKEYGKEALNLSLKRALYYQATDCQTIKNILKDKLYLLELEPRLEATDQTDGYVMSRPLTYYGGDTG